MTCPLHTIPTPVEFNYLSKMRVSNMGVTFPGVTIRQPDGRITDLLGNTIPEKVCVVIRDESPETIARRHAETEGVI